MSDTNVACVISTVTAGVWRRTGVMLPVPLNAQQVREILYREYQMHSERSRFMFAPVSTTLSRWSNTGAGNFSGQAVAATALPLPRGSVLLHAINQSAIAALTSHVSEDVLLHQYYLKHLGKNPEPPAQLRPQWTRDAGKFTVPSNLNHDFTALSEHSRELDGRPLPALFG
jgi:hypothetical protein